MKKYLLIFAYESKEHFGIFKLIESSATQYHLQLIYQNTCMNQSWHPKKKWFNSCEEWSPVWSDDLEELHEQAMLEIL